MIVVWTWDLKDRWRFGVLTGEVGDPTFRVEKSTLAVSRRMRVDRVIAGSREQALAAA